MYFHCTPFLGDNFSEVSSTQDSGFQDANMEDHPATEDPEEDSDLAISPDPAQMSDPGDAAEPALMPDPALRSDPALTPDLTNSVDPALMPDPAVSSDPAKENNEEGDKSTPKEGRLKFLPQIDDNPP